nr:hypothetical protein 3 [Piscirickettsiaceae bacterium]
MTNKEPTQLEKTLVIAKAMYGESQLKLKGDECSGDVITISRWYDKVKNNWLFFEEFNPYTSAEDSQAVQEFFRAIVLPTELDKWEVRIRFTANEPILTINKDLKTAIADCAYLVCKEK